MENPIKMDDLGVPLFSETPKENHPYGQYNFSTYIPPIVLANFCYDMLPSPPYKGNQGNSIDLSMKLGVWDVLLEVRIKGDRISGLIFPRNTEFMTHNIHVWHIIYIYLHGWLLCMAYSSIFG